ncbi:MAG: two-component regulator propeller domain-containing protein [Paludibacter sp.]|nr:two-component regulator propeller domain-containing protein [Paludibacter sp.]
MLKRFVICSIFLCSLVKPEAAPFSFRHYKVENGLSENSVFCSIQDNKGFMWFGTKDGLNRFDGQNFVVYHTIPKDKNSIGNNFIRSFHEDKNKALWVGTEKGIYQYSYLQNNFQHFDKKTSRNESPQSVNAITEDLKGNLWIATTSGLFKFEQGSNRLTSYMHNQGNKGSIPANFVSCVICDNKGIVWVGTLSGGLSRYNPKTNNFTNFKFSDENRSYSNSVLRILEDSQGNLILGTVNEGLIFFDRITTKSESYLLETSLERIYYFRDIFEYSPGVYLVGSEHGLILFEQSTGKITEMKSSTLVPTSLSDNAIYSIYKDREGGIWVGSYFGGVNYISPKSNPFELYSPLEYKNSVSGKAISQFCEDASGNLWIGTEDGGLDYFDVKNNSFKCYNHQPGRNSLSYHNVHSLMLDGDNLWIGTFAGGLNILNTKTGKFSFYTSTNDIHSLNDNNVFSIYKDLTGTIWVGTITGLCKYNRANNNFDRIPVVALNTHIYDIVQDHLGLIWVATYGRGLFCYNPLSNVWKQYVNDPNNPKSISHNKVISIYIDEKKRLWLGTEGGGLCQYLYDKNCFASYDVSSGLPNNVVYKVVSDHDYLWLSTNKGLVRFNVDSKVIKTFTKVDGLQGDQFNFKSGIKTRSGKIYFGGINGFNAFYPERLIENKYIPPVVISNLQLFNKNVIIGDNDSPLKQSISYTDEITLNYNQSFINLEFVALSYCAPDKNQYAYKLEGFDKDWNNRGNDHKISYTNLPPGKYTLHIKGSNNDGVWNADGVKLKINILPPFWASPLALFLYVVILVGGSYFTVKSFKGKQQREKQLNLDRVHAEKEIELYNAKIDFFTNIAHEIRTPLSLIKAPLDYILKKYTDKELNEYLSVMDRNTNRLMSLVNQLLDFRKAEKNSYTVNFKQTNINELLQSIYESFKYSTDSKVLTFELNLPEMPLIVKADVECITKIMSNLLSNAIKHAKDKITLSLVVDEGNPDNYQIQVFDNGNGINSSETDKIFQPFYQIKTDKKQNQGTGIGLALVKLLVEIHGGNIKVESVENEFTSFTLNLPMIKDMAIEAEADLQVLNQIIMPDIAPKENKQHVSYFNTELPSILIVEDNEDLNGFLVNYFKEDYSVLTTFNGSEAIKALESFSADIIISDIVMPEMDGLELCNLLKTNTLYSHIPVILLTARTDIKYKIEGLEHGADAYLEKPFSVEHLEAQVLNLLENREKLRENFIKSPLTPIRTIGKNKADEAFLLEITSIIEANITKVDFQVDEFATQIGMSRSNFYRKVKGISGLTPNDFIRLVKLKKAVKLMLDGETRINEICFMVGFNTSSYFAKCFRKQFGILPKDFIKNK